MLALFLSLRFLKNKSEFSSRPCVKYIQVLLINQNFTLFKKTGFDCAVSQTYFTLPFFKNRHFVFT